MKHIDYLIFYRTIREFNHFLGMNTVNSPEDYVTRSLMGKSYGGWLIKIRLFPSDLKRIS